MKKKKLLRRILFIFGWIVLAFLVIIGIASLVVYYRGESMIKKYLIEMVPTQSKEIYTLEVNRVHYSLLSGNLRIAGFKLSADTARYRQLSVSDTLPNILLELSIKKFVVKDIGLRKFFRKKKIDISEIEVDEPFLHIYRFSVAPKDTTVKKAKSPNPLHIEVPKGMNSVAAASIRLLNGNLKFTDCTMDSIRQYEIPSFDILITNFLTDTTSLNDDLVFNSEDITVNLRGIIQKSKDGMNEAGVGLFSISTGKNEILINNFTLKPLVSEYDYSRKLGYQTDRIDVSVQTVRVSRIDIQDLILHNHLHIGRIVIDSLKVYDYRDKRVPMRAGFQPPMIHDKIRKIKLPLAVDTIILQNGRVDYAEQVHEEPGTLFFDRMNYTVTGLTNDSAAWASGTKLIVKGGMRLQGLAEIVAVFTFNLADPRNSFHFSANVGPMDLVHLNSMVSKQLPAKITSGKLVSISVPGIYGNSDVATGKIIFSYKDLEVKLESEKESKWAHIKTGVVGFLANDIVLAKDNPNKKGELKPGYVHWQRDKSKGLLNMIWKSLFTGIKSTIGFNDKTQKEMKQQGKEKHAKPKK